MIAFGICATLMLAASVLWLSTASGPKTMTRHTTNQVLTLLVPVAAIALYARLGNLEAIVPPPVDANRAMAEQMVARLAARLRDDSDDLRGWRTLARSYGQLRRDAEAIEAYRRLVKLQPDDADALIDLAEALATLHGGRFAGEPATQVQRALAIDPDNARALAVAANEAGERDDVAAAIEHWERLRAISAPGSSVALAVQSNLEQARRELAQRAPASAER